MKVILKDVRLAFPCLWTPEPFEPGAPPKFNAAFLFPREHSAFATVNAAIKQVAQEKWGAEADKILASIKGVPNKMCFRNGDTKPDYEGYPGNFFISASNKARPDIRNRDKSPAVEADGVPYAGSYVLGIVDIWAQDNRYGKGIQSTLLGVQFMRDGDAFTPGAKATDEEFEDLGDGAAAGDVASAAAGGSDLF